MIIDIQKQIGVKLTLFPDNQPHVNLSDEVLSAVDHELIHVVAKIRSPKELFELCATCDALMRCDARLGTLVIPYLMAARSDRPMKAGGSCDLAVVTGMINDLCFPSVKILDPHSDITPEWVEDSIAIHAGFLLDRCQEVLSYETLAPVLVVPDAGAITRNFGMMDAIEDYSFQQHLNCIKSRDENGVVSLRVNKADPEILANKRVVVLDDLCDGGATFVAIGKQLRPICKAMALVVTHGIFSKGFSELSKYYDKIICSDSYQNPIGAPDGLLEVVPFDAASYV